MRPIVQAIPAHALVLTDAAALTHARGREFNVHAALSALFAKITCFQCASQAQEAWPLALHPRYLHLKQCVLQSPGA